MLQGFVSHPNQLVVELVYQKLFLLNNPIYGSPSSKLPVVEEAIKEKIELFVQKRLPLLLVLPAFPAKSPNRNKTLGALPDFAEVVALRKLQDLCDSIQTVYAPGVKLLICSDGRVFSDLVCVSDTAVNAYSKGLEEILGLHNLTSIALFNLDDVFRAHTFDEMRDSLLGEFSDSVEEIRERVKAVELERLLFNGIHRFVFEDRLSLEESNERSRSFVREESKKIAYEVVQRSQAWSRLVEKEFPEAIRLSIHPQLPESTKIPVKFFNADHQWRTPWHGVALQVGDSLRLTTRQAALQMGATYLESDSRWGYFEVATC